MITKGKWNHTKNESFIISEAGEVICDQPKNKANARLIAAACNACQEINPDNPQAAAESLVDLYEACRKSTAPNWLTDWQHFAEDMATKPNLAVYRQKFFALSALLKRTAESAEQIMQAFAKAEGKQ